MRGNRHYSKQTGEIEVLVGPCGARYPGNRAGARRATPSVSTSSTWLVIYLHDPDFNGIELVWDRDQSYWKPWYGATIERMPVLNKPLDFDSLLAELAKPPTTDAVSGGTSEGE